MIDFHQIVAVLVSIVVIIVVRSQCRKPTWWPGRFSAWSMNSRHSEMTDWGLARVVPAKHSSILDVGCGGGLTVHKLATAASEGVVFGLDYATGSVAAARRTNSDLIAAGRVGIIRASVSNLPFRDRQFDLVTAIETHYYWPNLLADVQEVRRALAPDGKLIIIAEAYKGMRLDVVYRLSMKLLGGAFLGPREYRELFETAGFVDVEVVERREKGWICVVGKRS